MTSVARPAPASGRPPAYLQVAQLTKRFGSATVLHDLNLTVEKGEFVSLLGPSGCGKTTLLRLIAGLMRPETGRIVIADRELTRVPAHKRQVGVVFQNYALFPHLTVAENVAFGLTNQRRSRDEIKRRVGEALQLVRMAPFADRSVSALSGGQQQRIAVARAIVVEPAILLLDEPFSALDRKLRETMQIELRHILRDLGITSIFVTHDQDEALVMSDRIAVMNEGQIEHLGTPADIYTSPKSLFVLEFVGLSTRLGGTVVSSHGGEVEVETAFGRMRAPAQFRPGSPVVVAVRPEAISIGESEGDGRNVVRARLTDVVYLGAKTQLHLRGERSGDLIQAEIARLPPGGLPSGSELALTWRVEDTMVFPAPASAAS
ncbi:ABC transporter ATP-binding protein [Enterovirga rhinocerotis]|uniref:Spermidine/putrescine import ATP-binding protein PotA n=1 Tax=Enterovirga rhinocerotis TaxID=1339210 RepID=A0A4R7C0V4_9HYPH|nr:ABC transporter ATP-binding protein [Enterovirga rhinocerotis]TDR90127.1 putative spermidine/putrescine transport system ATP-binding protein [Enterovirga rhinocerotis]